jgi:outer membrane receptor protein involved in Fe transport
VPPVDFSGKQPPFVPDYVANLGFRVRNLTDEFYATFGSSNGRQAMIAAPRTFEVSLNLRY